MNVYLDNLRFIREEQVQLSHIRQSHGGVVERERKNEIRLWSLPLEETQTIKTSLNKVR